MLHVSKSLTGCLNEFISITLQCKWRFLAQSIISNQWLFLNRFAGNKICPSFAEIGLLAPTSRDIRRWDFTEEDICCLRCTGHVAAVALQTSNFKCMHWFLFFFQGGGRREERRRRRKGMGLERRRLALICKRNYQSWSAVCEVTWSTCPILGRRRI